MPRNYICRALLCLLLATMFASHAHATDTTPPVIASANISPTGMFIVTHAPVITITASVTAVNKVASVGVRIYEDGVWNNINGTLLDNGGHGSTYTGMYDLSTFNSDHSMPHTYTVQVLAGDYNNNIASVFANGSVVVKADDALPVVTQAVIAPVGAVGASDAPIVSVSATVTDPGADATGIGWVYATLFRDGVAQDSLYSIVLSNGGSGDVYTGTFDLSNFGPNNSTQPHVYTVEIEARDNAGEQTVVQADGSVTVKNDPAAFPIGAIHLTPTGTFPAGEPPKNIILAAAVNFPSGVRRVRYDIYRNGIRVSADRNFFHYSADSLYASGVGLPDFGHNTTDALWVYTFKIRATANDGTAVSVNVPGSITVLNDNSPPILSDFHAAPGGTYGANSVVTYTLTAHASDTGADGTPRRLRSVTVKVTGGPEGVSIFTLPQVGTALYKLTFSFHPRNIGTAPYVYSFKATATDLAGNSVSRAAPETVTVLNDDTPPVVTEAHISPTGTYAPLSAPTVAISTHVHDAGVGLYTVSAIVSAPGGYSRTVPLTSAGGDLYTGTCNLQFAGPANAPAPLVYTASIYALDKFYLSSVTPADGTVTVLTDTHAPAVSHFTVSPTFIPNAGGSVQVQATVTDNQTNDTGVKSVTAGVIHDGQYVSFALTKQGSKDVYAASFTAPAGDTNTHFYTIVLSTLDNAGNGLSLQRGAVQEGTTTQPVPTLSAISPDSTFTRTPVTVTATGTGFTPASVALVGGQLFAAKYVSPTQITFDLGASSFYPTLLARPSVTDVKIVNPAPGGGMSNALPFTIKPSVKTFTLAVSSVMAGETATGVITLETPALTDETITLSSNIPAVASVPASLSFAVGQKTATFPIATSAVKSATSVQINAAIGYHVQWANLTVTPSPETFKLLPVADAFVQDGAFADTNYGAATTLNVKTDMSDGTGNNRDTYLLFDTSGFVNVSSAHLRFWAAVSDDTSPTLTATLYGVGDYKWHEGTVTYNHHPALDTALTTVNVSGTTYALYDADVTQWVNKRIGGNYHNPLISFGLHNLVASTAAIKLNSKENATHPPVLLVVPSP